MTYRIAKPGEIIVEAQERYPGSFYDKVSSSKYMDEFYKKAVEASGVVKLIESREDTVRVVDVAGGRGRVGEMIRKMTDKNFEYIVVDISRKEMGDDKDKVKIVGDMAHIPLKNSSADVVFFLNMPVPISLIKRKAETMTPGSLVEVEELWSIKMYLGNSIDAAFRSNMLEGLRVLKPDGVLVTGAKHVGQSKEVAEEAFREFPLRVEKQEVVELDSKVIPLWRKYGLGLEDPKFVITTYRRVEGNVESLIEHEKERLERNLGKAMEMETFWKVMEEFRKEKWVPEEFSE
ncbi:MAG: class I SAM-dependent methyltransferase [Candidatus Micrarchaeia archaeon]